MKHMETQPKESSFQVSSILFSLPALGMATVLILLTGIKLQGQANINYLVILVMSQSVIKKNFKETPKLRRKKAK